MNAKLGVAIVFLLALCAGLLAWPIFKPSAHTQALTKWEYDIVAIPDERFESELNKLGAAGWEVVSARRASDGSTYDPKFAYEIIMKRPKQSAAPSPQR